MRNTHLMPVACLVLLTLVMLLGRRRTDDRQLPPGHQPVGAVDRPLPVDRRAHLTWLAHVSPDEKVRRAATELVDEDDKFRGRGPHARRP